MRFCHADVSCVTSSVEDLLLSLYHTAFPLCKMWVHGYLPVKLVSFCQERAQVIHRPVKNHHDDFVVILLHESFKGWPSHFELKCLEQTYCNDKNNCDCD